MWVNIKFVLWQPHYFNLFTEKKGEEKFVFEALIFLKTCRYCQSHEIFFKHDLQMIYMRKILHAQIQLF